MQLHSANSSSLKICHRDGGGAAESGLWHGAISWFRADLRLLRLVTGRGEIVCRMGENG